MGARYFFEPFKRKMLWRRDGMLEAAAGFWGVLELMFFAATMLYLAPRMNRLEAPPKVSSPRSHALPGYTLSCSRTTVEQFCTAVIPAWRQLQVVVRSDTCQLICKLTG